MTSLRDPDAPPRAAAVEPVPAAVDPGREVAFVAFAADGGVRLRRALVASFGVEVGNDVANDAMGVAWAKWDDVSAMANPDTTLERRLRDVARHLDDVSRAHLDARDAYARPVVSGVATRGPGGRRPAFLIAAAALLVVAVAGVLAVAYEGGQTVPATQPGDSELVVLVADGWSLTRHDEYDGEAGEYDSRYTSAAGAIDLHRRALGYNDEFSQGAPQTWVFGYAVHVLDAGTETRAFWRTQRFDFELRGAAGGEHAFLALLGQLRQVDDAGYRAVIDPVVERPEDRAALVDQMLGDVPLPPGFSTEALIGGAVAQDRYQVGARVMGAVACAWMDSFVAAKAAGDAAGVARAAAALDTSHRWRTLIDMQDQGAYPEVLWRLADAVAHGPELPGGKVGITVGQSYTDALGCGR